MKGQSLCNICTPRIREVDTYRRSVSKMSLHHTVCFLTSLLRDGTTAIIVGNSAKTTPCVLSQRVKHQIIKG